ncbi:MAG: TIGR04086 family membrane protein [Tepidanaerobacteraceae bacterium]|jgi:putative membrane protein (TIGR04086 family)
MKTSLDKRRKINHLQIFKGVLFAYVLTLLLFLILGGVLFFTSLSEGVIPSLIVIISAVSIILSGIRATRGLENMGWLHGGVIGFLYMGILLLIRIFVISSVPQGLETAIDLFVGFALGVVSGILGVNL